MENAQPLVTIIVVTLNNSDLLRNCLNSLNAQDYSRIEIVVVDNGSDEDIGGMLAQEFPKTHTVRLDMNYGFAGGNNRGIETARGKYIALINNDAVASPQWIRSLVATAESDSGIGAVASIIIDGNRPDVLDSCGVGIGLDGMSRQAMRGQPVPQLMQPEEVLLFSGCACLLKTKVLRQVGMFDEDFFAYCEDTDLGLRLRLAGYKTVVAPDAYVHHYYSMTGGKFSLKKIYWVERNHFWAAIKNFPWLLLASLPIVTIWRYILQGYLVLKGAGDLNKFTEHVDLKTIISVYLKAYVDMVKKLPSMLERRRNFRKIRRLCNTDMLLIIWKYHLSIKEILGIEKK